MVNSRSIILLNFTHTIKFHVEHEMLQEISQYMVGHNYKQSTNYSHCVAYGRLYTYMTTNLISGKFTH